MKILICTQKVSINDDVLGFMHGWIEAFSKECESISVICLESGEYHLPHNVSVHSLGKERGFSRLQYLFNFYRLLWRLRGSYDAVFVHMNPEYLLLGGFFWRLTGTRTGFWYNHRMGGMRARIGIAFAKVVFYTSPFAFASRFKKAQSMPAGIDTEQFKTDERRAPKPRSILSLGRLDPVKQIEVIIEALQKLAEKGVSFVADFYGNPGNNRSYFEGLRRMAGPLIKQGCVRFFPAVPNNRAAAVYNEHSIFVNATPAGSFDKSVLEAMSCERPTLSCNPSFQGLLSDELLFREGDSADLADRLEALLSKSREDLQRLGKVLREAVVREQSLALLIPKLVAVLR